MDPRGTPDGNETLNVSKDDILWGCKTPFGHLPCFNEQTASNMAAFTRSAHTALLRILDVLSEQLGLTGEHDLRNLHSMEKTSEDHIRFVKYSFQTQDRPESDVMLEPHTDFGSLTLLFTHTKCLQIVDDRSQQWLWVEPKAGAAVVNFGDALVKFTNGLLPSIQHRVIRPPALTPNSTKYSLCYFLRPSSHIKLRPLPSKQIRQSDDEEAFTSKEWQDMRVAASKIGVYRTEQDWKNLRGTASVWK